MTRTYARAPQGKRAVDRVPRNRGIVTTILGALTIAGLTSLMTVEGGTSGEVFERFVREHLLPTLCEGDVVVMDNLAAHHRRVIVELIESVGAEVRFLPPYSPDLNPIEWCWSKLKELLRSVGARTKDALFEAIRQVQQLITADDAQGWVRGCGYGNQLK